MGDILDTISAHAMNTDFRPSEKQFSLATASLDPPLVLSHMHQSHPASEQAFHSQYPSTPSSRPRQLQQPVVQLPCSTSTYHQIPFPQNGRIYPMLPFPGTFNMTQMSQALPQAVGAAKPSPLSHQQHAMDSTYNAQARTMYDTAAITDQLAYSQAQMIGSYQNQQAAVHGYAAPSRTLPPSYPQYAGFGQNNVYKNPLPANSTNPMGLQQPYMIPNHIPPSHGTMYPERVYHSPEIGMASSYGSAMPPGGAIVAPSVPVYVNDSGSNQSSVPRGPPRKPRQSGHALWVGNLPPGAAVVDLKDHFSRDATNDIESVKLISKSNCAFVNYRTQAACAAAMTRFHDSRFHGTRLVCRLRRASAPAPSANSLNPEPTKSTTSLASMAIESPIEESKPQLLDGESSKDGGNTTARFFVLKSLTLQDLEMSARNGIWATQAHNEEHLNEAYKSAEQVYLVFSANKSGEYFGYARMASGIPAPDATELAAASVLTPSPLQQQQQQQQPPQQPISSVPPPASSFGPRSIPTPATEWAPRGRIIDDSARGTIFWEADARDQHEPVEDGAADSTATDGKQPDDDGAATEYPLIARSPGETTHKLFDELAAAEQQQARGNPFRIEWLSTRKVPFFRTRGLRNPWNANREVKIARDGTEIEPAVGKKLIGLFGGSVP